MADTIALLRKELEQLNDAVAKLAGIELTLHNELGELAKRTVRAREAIREAHQVTQCLAEIIETLEERLEHMRRVAR